MWTFGRKVSAGFAICFALLLAIGVVAYRNIEALMTTSYAVTRSHVVIEHINTVLGAMRDAETGQRGFVITGDDAYLEPFQAGSSNVATALKDLRDLTRDNAPEQRALDEAEALVNAKLTELRHAIDARRAGGFEASRAIIVGGAGKKTMDDLRAVLGRLDHEERAVLQQRSQDAEAAASASRSTIAVGTIVCLFFAVIAGFAITRSLTQQIGTAVQRVQTSSTELQAATNQQATGARESATSMNEIATTISELLATSRQIYESARRVSHVADQTAGAARAGDGTVTKASESVTSIRRQVDLIVTHMLELGKKSQQIGAVVEIVSELAEQTNILAINATIEAAGAGDAGKRFGVVADEIRKLADRVGGSAKEIRSLIEDVRSAVNTTVMTTETGSKSVDAGSRHFGEVASAFEQIASLVATTTEAAREIELSTKQQTTAVEQVNLAIANVTQAAKETETSSTQTLSTVSELTSLATDLYRLVEPRASA